MRAAQVMCFLHGGATLLDESTLVTVRSKGRRSKEARVCPGCSMWLGEKGSVSLVVDEKRYVVKVKRETRS